MSLQSLTILLLAATTVGCPVSVSAEILPLSNPGFEEPAPRGLIPGWWMSQHAGVVSYEMALDTDAKSGSRQAFRMKRLVHQEFGTIHQRIVLPPNSVGKKVTLSGLMKSKAVGAEGWLLVLNIESASSLGLSAGMLAQERSQPVTGTSDWHRVSVDAVIPPRAATLDVGAMLLDEGAGWIDDVELSLE